MELESKIDIVDFQHFEYIHSVPGISQVSINFSVLLNELNILSIRQEARHTYGATLWQRIWHGVIAKILGHREYFNVGKEVYGPALEKFLKNLIK